MIQHKKTTKTTKKYGSNMHLYPEKTHRKKKRMSDLHLDYTPSYSITTSDNLLDSPLKYLFPPLEIAVLEHPRSDQASLLPLHVRLIDCLWPFLLFVALLRASFLRLRLSLSSLECPAPLAFKTLITRTRPLSPSFSFPFPFRRRRHPD